MKSSAFTRILFVPATILVLLFLLMQFSKDMDWTLFDFAVVGALLVGANLVYELVVRKIENTGKRAILSTVLILAILIIWADLAVGIFNIPGFSGS
ncbi:MAG: hypothetical protein ACAH35_04895 [Candidatus Paceibacterota bacterium]